MRRWRASLFTVGASLVVANDQLRFLVHLLVPGERVKRKREYGRDKREKAEELLEVKGKEWED